MAEMTGVPYGKLIIHAALILYYVAVLLWLTWKRQAQALWNEKDELPVFSKYSKMVPLLLAPKYCLYALAGIRQ